MGGLANTLPAVIRPGWGGYTYPIKNPVIMNLDPVVDDELCTATQAQKFLGLVLFQADVAPEGSPVSVRVESQFEMNVDKALIEAGYRAYVIEFAGPNPGPNFRDQVPPGSPIVLTPEWPAYFSILIGLMLESAPQVPGSQSSNGQRAFRTDQKVQVKADGSLGWAGLDQPTWPGLTSTAEGSNTNA